MTNKEKELAREVRRRFGVPVPTWRTLKGGKSVRVLSRNERDEQAALTQWLCDDTDYLTGFAVYFDYCSILKWRGYGSGKGRWDGNTLPWHTGVTRNFAECMVSAVYYNMCCDPETILGNGSADGYWIYLDRPYLDIAHMTVGDAVLNLEEIWAVVYGALQDWQRKAAERERDWLEHGVYKCDRCGAGIYDKAESRFDAYENLLHCPACVKGCTHWAKIDKQRGGR